MLSVAVILASCTSSSPTPSPGANGSTTESSAPDESSSPLPEIEADSASKIDDAERAGAIDHDTALLYKVYASLDYGSLPVAYQSSNPASEEATTILAELSGRLDALPAELRAKVNPFFLRPTDPDSFWQKRSATALAPGSIQLATFSLIDYKYVDATDTAVRVWYPVCSALVPVEDCHDPAGGAPYVERAQQLADEIDNSAMWDKEKTAMLGHEPCTDASSPNNGGDGRLDIYLVATGRYGALDWGGRAGTLDPTNYGKTLPGVDVPETVENPGCPTTSHIIVDSNRDFDRLKSTAAHELFHAFQFSFKNAVLSDRDWWVEASATWAMDLVYPRLNHEQGYLKGYWSMAGGNDEGPLDNTAGMAEYGAYLWAFYLVQKSGDTGGTAVGHLWQASETLSPIEAMGQLAGWSDRFKEFALWNWNKESFSVKYIDAGAQISEAKLSQDTTCMVGSGKTDCLLKLGKTTTQFLQFPTSVQYYEGVPDKAVQLLRFDLSQLRGKPGLGIQAILSIGQQAGTKVEDWTALSERKFCLNSEDLRKIVLIVSNSNVASDQAIDGAIKVEALAAGCGGFVGSADALFRDESGAVVATAHAGDVVWQEDPTAPGSGTYHVVSGTLDWSLPGTWISTNGLEQTCSYTPKSGSESLIADEPNGSGGGESDVPAMPGENNYLFIDSREQPATYRSAGVIAIHTPVREECGGSLTGGEVNLNFFGWGWMSTWIDTDPVGGKQVSLSGGHLVVEGNYSVRSVEYSWKFTSSP